jgi:hypothetical protein
MPTKKIESKSRMPNKKIKSKSRMPTKDLSSLVNNFLKK